MFRLRNQRGQSLIEYLILVSLMGIASLVAVRTLSQNVITRFAIISDAIHGSKGPARKMDRIEESQTKKRDMSDFFRGSVQDESE